MASDTAKLLKKRGSDKTVKTKIISKSTVAAAAKILPSLKLTPGCYKNSRTALDFIIAKRWNERITCPLCGADKVYLLQSNARTKKSSTGSIRIKCAACRRQFSAISNTALAGCRLKPDQILRAVYYVSFRPRRTSYTIEKYAAEVGITSKSAKRFLTILTQNCSTSAIKKYGTVPSFTGQSDNSTPVLKKTKENFLALRNSLPGDGDQLINYLLKTRQ
jgi:transposase-like protein